jgi:copper homeostasis protein
LKELKTMSRILLEICCGSIDDAIEAEKGGADRVELCSALFLGGLTPSLGTVIEVTSRLKIPVIAMVRPRGGGFCYTDMEMAAMERDTVLALEHGADGIVFGILKENGTVDMERTRRVRRLIGDRQAVFHRAFDVAPDPFKAVDQLVDLGITRILTSGQQDSVPEGFQLIKKLIDYAGDRIEIMPGGGIKPHGVDQVVAATGCRQIHLTAFKTQCDSSTHSRSFVTFGGALYPPEDRFQMTDQELVRNIIQRLK